MVLDVGKQLGAGAAIAEETRGNERLDGLMAKLFKGKLDLDLLFDWVGKPSKLNPKVDEMCAKLADFLVKKVDAEEIERTKEVPRDVIQWFCDNGYFGLKIPEEYGGMGFVQSEYMKILQLAATWSGAIVALLSASNTIGVGWPIMAYGSPEQKAEWLPIVAKHPSGFAFTEEKAGSDPSAMETVAGRIKNRFGKTIAYCISGRKWWTTNGPMNDSTYLSPVIIIIAKIIDRPDELEKNRDNKDYRPCFGAFILPTNYPGIEVVQRCELAGLNGIYTGMTDFHDVVVPKSQLLGKKVLPARHTDIDKLTAETGIEVHPEDKLLIYKQEGCGFRIALEALNSGRITLAASCVAMAKNCVSVGKWWGNKRFQWGKLIGKHEAVGSGMLANDLATAFALEAMVWYAARQADNHRDCRMEAATCKVLASERGYEIADNLLQMRGGRGYETAASLKKRGEAPIPAERWWRDTRINRIFEGESGTLLRMFVVREGLNDYMERGKVFFDKDNKWGKLKAASGFAKDLLALCFAEKLKKQSAFAHLKPKLAEHMLFVEANARRLATTIIVLSGKYRDKLANKQLTLRRLFQTSSELYAMATVCAYATYRDQTSDFDNYATIADLYCLEAQRRIQKEFAALKENNDSEARAVAKDVLDGYFDGWLKENIIPTVDALDLKG